MLITIGWALIILSILLAILISVAGVKAGIRTDIEELNRIKSSGFVSAHQITRTNNIYREENLKDAAIPIRSRTVSASARELLNEVEAEMGNARKSNPGSQAQRLSGHGAPEEGTIQPQTPSPQGTDVLAAPSGGVRVEAGTDVLIIGRDVSPAKGPTDVLPELASGESLDEFKGASKSTDILGNEGPGTGILWDTDEAEPEESSETGIAGGGTDVLADIAANKAHDRDDICSEGTDVLTEGTDILSGTDVLSSTGILPENREPNMQGGTDVLADRGESIGTDVLTEGTDILILSGTDVLTCNSSVPAGEDAVGTDMLHGYPGTGILPDSSPDSAGTDVLVNISAEPDVRRFENAPKTGRDDISRGSDPETGILPESSISEEQRKVSPVYPREERAAEHQPDVGTELLVGEVHLPPHTKTERPENRQQSREGSPSTNTDIHNTVRNIAAELEALFDEEFI